MHFLLNRIKKHIYKHIEQFQRKSIRTIIWDACSTTFIEFIEFFYQRPTERKRVGHKCWRMQGICDLYVQPRFQFSLCCAVRQNHISRTQHSALLSCMFGLMCLASCFIVCLQLSALGKRCRGTRYNRHTLLFIVCSLYLRLLCYLIENWVLQIVKIFKAFLSWMDTVFCCKFVAFYNEKLGMNLIVRNLGSSRWNKFVSNKWRHGLSYFWNQLEKLTKWSIKQYNF